MITTYQKGDILIHRKEGYRARVNRVFKSGELDLTVVSGPKDSYWERMLSLGLSRVTGYLPIENNFDKEVQP